MKRTFTLMLLLFVAITMMAVPAKRGIKKSITLADGSTVVAELAGDEYMHYWRDAAGNVYQFDSASGRYQKAEMKQLQTKANQRRIARKAVRRRATSASTADGLGKYGTSGAGAVNTIGSYTFPVIMVQFSDTKFKSTTTVAKMKRYYNEEGYSDETGCVGSVRDYFNAQSYGKFVPTFDVVGIVTLSKAHSAYGGNDSSGNDKDVDGLVSDAVAAAVSQLGTDFSKYAVSGKVPLVCILYAGGGEATNGGDDTVWPCEYDCETTMSGTYFNAYFVGNELYDNSLMGIGVFCHEFGHAAGLPDWYCTNYNYSNDDPYADWSIMDTGAYVANSYAPVGYTALERSMLGWLDIPEVSTKADADGKVTLDDPNSFGVSAVKITTSDSKENFILENRQQGTWYTNTSDGKSYGNGLMLSRVAYNASDWNNDVLNNTQSKKRSMIVTADGKKLSYGTNVSQANLYGNGVNAISSLSRYSGSKQTTYVSAITKNSDKTLTFTWTKASSDTSSVTPTPSGDGDVYVKVTSDDQLVAGKKYLIVNEDNSKALSVLGGSSRSPYRTAADVTIDGNTITTETNGDGQPYQLTLGGSAGAWTFYDATTGAYMAYTSTATKSSNYIYNVTDATANGTTWTISVGSSATTIKNVYNTSRELQYNHNNGTNSRFSCYTTDQSDIVLYVQQASTPTPSTDPVLTVSPSSLSFNAAPGATATQTFTVTGQNLKGDVTATLSDANNVYSLSATSVTTADAASGKAITVTFKPTAAGTFAGTVTLASDGATSQTVTLNGTATAPAVATPTFTPAAGTYTTAQNVTIATATDGAAIHYTTDGTEPTASSTTYTAAIAVSATTTIKAIAVKDGYSPSAVATATYTIVDPAASYQYKKVTTITSGKQYLIVVNNSGTLEAASPVASDKTYGYLAKYDVTASDDVITLTTKDYEFTFAATDSGYTIRQNDGRYLYQTGSFNSFNVNATAPTSGQNWTAEPQSDGTFKITNTSVSKYIQYNAQYSSYGSYSSTTGSMPSLYELQGSETPVVTVAAPTFSPEGGTFTEAQTIELATATAGATIYYTTDGSDPTTSTTRQEYTGAITVDATATVKAYATDGTHSSAVVSQTYTISTGTESEVVLFKETFDQCNSKGGNDGGWNGNVASGAFNPDMTGWSTTNAYGASQCAKFGTGSKVGTATSPAFTLTGEPSNTYTLTFKAGAWNASKDGTTLTVTIIDATASAKAAEGVSAKAASFVGDNTFTMPKGSWGTFTVQISGSGSVQLQFATNSGRFFLDDVVVSYKTSATPTGIDTVNTDTQKRLANGRIYTLSGQYVGTDMDRLPAGIYICNGKKLVKR